MTQATTFPCPACGFLTFSEPPGSYEICVVCGWEDDPVQLAHPLLRGGANATSLCERQRDVMTRLPLETQQHEGRERDPTWRPLTEEEATVRADAPDSGLAYFGAAVEDAPPYYWRKSRDEDPTR